VTGQFVAGRSSHVSHEIHEARRGSGRATSGQIHRECADQEDLRLLLDMLGLISANPEQPPPVTR